MPEILKTPDARFEGLCEYIKGLEEGKITREHFDIYRELLESATPLEVNRAVDWAVEEYSDQDTLKKLVGRFIRSASRGIEAVPVPIYPDDHYLARLTRENGGFTGKFMELSGAVKRLQKPVSVDDAVFLEVLALLKDFIPLADHYRDLQNNLFPLLEQSAKEYRCTQLMWTIQDDVQKSLKALLGRDKPKNPEDYKEINRLLGLFFMDAQSLIYREERILFPLAYGMIPGDKFRALSSGYPALGTQDVLGKRLSPADYDSVTGSLSRLDLDRIFGLLPVDISFINKDDQVQFYSDPPHRIFPRTPGVIGRKVQNCHPPKSVALVEDILSAFRKGEKDSARFWIDRGGRFLLIEYFAVRNETGGYEGTLEVSQDVTEIRSLTGERRLPD